LPLCGSWSEWLLESDIRKRGTPKLGILIVLLFLLLLLILIIKRRRIIAPLDLKK